MFRKCQHSQWQDSVTKFWEKNPSKNSFLDKNMDIYQLLHVLNGWHDPNNDWLHLPLIGCVLALLTNQRLCVLWSQKHHASPLLSSRNQHLQGLHMKQWVQQRKLNCVNNDFCLHIRKVFHHCMLTHRGPLLQNTATNTNTTATMSNNTRLTVVKKCCLLNGVWLLIFPFVWIPGLTHVHRRVLHIYTGVWAKNITFRRRYQRSNDSCNP